MKKITISLTMREAQALQSLLSETLPSDHPPRFYASLGRAERRLREALPDFTTRSKIRDEGVKDVVDYLAANSPRRGAKTYRLAEASRSARDKTQK